MTDFPAPPAKKTKGRAPFDPAPHLASVEAHARAGLTNEDIAARIGCSVPTLRKHFAAALSAARAPACPADTLFSSAHPPGETALEPPPPLPVQMAPRRPRALRGVKGGRHRWQPTAAQRSEARLLIAANIRAEAIARRFGVTAPTVRRVFRDEFATAYDAEMAALLVDMRRAASRGSVPAMVKLREALEAAELSRLSDRVGAAPVADQPRPPAEDLGKKARANAEAIEAAISGPLADLLAGPDGALGAFDHAAPVKPH